MYLFSKTLYGTCLATAQAREKRYAAQLARRKETLEALSTRDKAALARPKGYEDNGGVVGSKASGFSFCRMSHVMQISLQRDSPITGCAVAW